jgi:pyruvate dehydrogenase (quinone)
MPFISSPCGSQDDNDYGHDNKFRNRGGIHAGVRRSRARLGKLDRDRRNNSPLYPQYIAATIAKLADNDAVFIFDIGTPSIRAAHLT